MKGFFLTSATGILAMAATCVSCGVAGDKEPSVTKQPHALALAAVGQAATFSVEASGKPAPTFQWQISSNDGTNWDNIPGATSASYTTGALAASGNNNQYRVKVANDKGMAISGAATLRVLGHATVSCGTHTLAIKDDGTLWAWGHNGYGQLGRGTWNNVRNDPAQISGTHPAGWLSVAAGEVHSVGLSANGSIWAWGDGEYGQLGHGDNEEISTATRVGAASDWVAVAAGIQHTLAIKANGTLWAWGDNEDGQLGIGRSGEYEQKNVPTQVGAATNWAAVAAGEWHTLALKNDGTLWAWGYNGRGQLGVGTSASQFAPSQVGAEKDWVAISCGESFSVALKADGTLWAWGRNTNGQLGIGNNDDQNAPVKVGSASDWKAVMAGYSHTVALRNNGSIMVWGNGSGGRLGDGTNASKNVPAPLSTATTPNNNWAFAAGASHSAALKSQGSLWAWGDNARGKLGTGDAANYNTPQEVQGHAFRLP
jgi:alpha-tubulin suppressor-like RCC1 family protein